MSHKNGMSLLEIILYYLYIFDFQYNIESLSDFPALVQSENAQMNGNLQLGKLETHGKVSHFALNRSLNFKTLAFIILYGWKI